MQHTVGVVEYDQSTHLAGDTFQFYNLFTLLLEGGMMDHIPISKATPSYLVTNKNKSQNAYINKEPDSLRQNTKVGHLKGRARLRGRFRVS